MFNTICRFATIFLSVLLLNLGSLKAQTSVYLKYVEQYKEMAIEQMQKYKIPASITLAQGLLESAAGTSRLAREANNHFGIKCHSDWKGKYIRQDDDARGEKFRVYANAKESYEDHSIFLKKSRYASLFKLKITDYKGWAYGLKRCGYATNPKYAQLLIDLIERFKLYQYDQYSNKTYTSKQSKQKKSNKLTLTANNNKGLIVKRCNKNYYVVAREGDTWKTISKAMGVSVRKLQRYNEVDKRYVLSKGDIVYLEKKRKKAAKELSGHFHRVKRGQSIYTISQLYGMRMETIYKINKFNYNHIPNEGDLIRIR